MHPPKVFTRLAIPLAIQIILSGSAISFMVLPSIAFAEVSDSAKKFYDVAAGSLEDVLNQFARQAGITLSFDPSQVMGENSSGLKGQYSVEDGLKTILETGHLEAVKAQNGTYSLRKANPTSDNNHSGNTEKLPEVTVNASSAEPPNALPKTYAGNQVARGGRMGLLGNKDFMDSPFNMTSYSAATIQNQQARSVADIVQNDPSVRMVSPQTNGSEVFNIRGFAVNNQDISFDGLYGILPYWRGSIAAAERVEILKGPNALLNGMAPSGSVGGAINVVPKRASDTPLTQLTGTYISGSNFGGQIDIGRRFGPDNQIGVRLNTLYRDGDISRTSQENAETALALDYRGERVRASVDLGYQKLTLNKVEGLTSLALGAQVPTPPSASNSYYQSWTTWKNETTYGVVRGEFDINPNLTIYGAYGGRRFDDNYLFPFGFGLTSSGNFTEGFAYASSWYRNTSAEAGLRGSFETGPIKHRASIAITDFNQDSGVLSGAAPLNPSNIYNPTSIPQPNLAGLSNVGKTGQLDLSSVAIADTLSILEDKLQLTLGLRKQQVKIDSFNGTTGVKTLPGYDKEAVTPALGIVVKPWQKIAFYGNYIEGLSQGPTAPITAFNAGQIFAPFKSKQQEVGAKFDFGTLATTVSLFQITKPSGLTNPATNIFSVDGEQRNRGVELNIFGEVASGVRILGGGMLLDGKQTKTANGTFDGKNAVNTPKVTLNLGGEWDTSLIQGLTLSARAIYTDSAYIDAANTQQIPSWTRFDAGARYALNTLKTPITVRANVENVFDRTYWMSSSLYRGNPRTLTLSATIDF